ncbi:MAG: hypothetical protein IPP74_03465 [Alphaproteobacteria bacterium]|nr:hypothetical protein [Alphaproteobacteria bacterium]
MAKGSSTETKVSSSSSGYSVPVPDYIPYTCHYDPHTVISKNGELIQVIKITGFNSERVGALREDLREIIKRAIRENIKDDRFVLRFHTIRKRKDIRLEGNFRDEISHQINDSWNDIHDWKNQFVNEVYLSVVHEAQLLNIKDKKTFMRTLSAKHEFAYRQKFFDESFRELNTAVEGMLNNLNSFGAARLGVIKVHGEYYSELISFFGKIIFLSDILLPMPTMDISEYMATHRIAFGFNAVEVLSNKGIKHFGALFTIKDAPFLTPETLDKLLHLPHEFIICQSGGFVPAAIAKDEFDYRKRVFEVSGDEEFSVSMGLPEITALEGDTNFVKQYVSLMLISGNLQKLEEDVAAIISVFQKIGLVLVRRDVFLQQCFWAQLPGNFQYIRHTTNMPASKLGGFATIYNFPAGSREDNHWGEAITLFRTANGTPYFFNFHKGDVGHTSIIGPLGMGKTVLTNFLIAQSLKFQPRILYLDLFNGSEVFLKSIGASYHLVGDKDQSVTMNPFALKDSPENREFLLAFISNLLTHGTSLSDASHKSEIQNLITDIYKLPVDQRYFSEIYKQLAATHPLLADLTDWVGEGKNAPLFDNRSDSFLEGLPIIGYNISNLIHNKECLMSFMSYFVFRINTLIRDNQKTIIVMDEAWKVLDNEVLAPVVEKWLNYLKIHNSMLILASESPEEVSKSKITSGIVSKLATQIFLPNPQAKETYKSIFGLKDVEYSKLREMNILKRQFLLKQGDVAVITELNLKTMKYVHLLSSDQKKSDLMKECIKETGDDPVAWVPLFISRAGA